ncbi:hypothetical protein GCM10010315_45850 [Streptomyces luteosporeus]|uniref:Uncharacterized protein n=1 Tax=Streptomyces luteosporeus TaxID=173856 RepID=A0ABN3U3G8_9ACTN
MKVAARVPTAVALPVPRAPIAAAPATAVAARRTSLRLFISPARLSTAVALWLLVPVGRDPSRHPERPDTPRYGD